MNAPAPRILVIGLDDPEVTDLQTRTSARLIADPALPMVTLEAGVLYAESSATGRPFVPDKVIFHGIFEDDLDLIAGLALWGGPVLPNARGMLDGRLKLPCLVRAAAVSRYGAAARGYASTGALVRATGRTVAKWGNWHCGENKVVFDRFHHPDQPTWYEPYWEGESVRVIVIGDRTWQVALAGPDWLKSIHDPAARFVEPRPELVEDAVRLVRHFGLEIGAVDYQVEPDGTTHLLELNHIPSVTCFEEVRTAYLDLAAAWIAAS